ncbi:MAG TPA: CerR family C-terminal domain-containing protein [Candidatus Acidoferrales bacterium]|nr:CerR family C-terminal domain-containing protein [Candidatus Acidoferrales bacterium]
MAEAAVRRDESSNRGEDARRRLVDAALEVFGAHGFDGASTRILAEKAGVNLAAIPYYFGGKEGLYRATAEYIVEASNRELAPVMTKINSALAAARRPTRQVAAALLRDLLERFSWLLIGSGQAERWSNFVMREQMQPGAAFEILYSGIMRPVTFTCARLLGVLFQRSADDPRIAIRAQSILGQVLIFRVSHRTALRHMGWKEFSAERVKLIQSVVFADVDRIIAAGK